MVVRFSFSVIVLCTCITKLIHLYTYAGTIPNYALIAFLPSVVIPDIVVICLARLALIRKRTVATCISRLVGCTFSLVALGASAFHIVFYYETGTEVVWHSARRQIRDRDGIRILLSGFKPVSICIVFILVISWLCRECLYNSFGGFLSAIMALFVRVWEGYSLRKVPCHRQLAEEDYREHDPVKIIYGNKHRETQSQSPRRVQTSRSSTYRKALLLSAVFYTAVTLSLRPSSPYSDMSASLPITVLQAMMTNSHRQTNQHTSTINLWPLPDLLHKQNWESPKANFKGWAPGNSSVLAHLYQNHVPTWISKTPPAGFEKWSSTNRSNKENQKVNGEGDTGSVRYKADAVDGVLYNPVSDPLKITNQDREILDVFNQSLTNGSVRIKHIALIMLESTREELFPLQQESDIHRIIMNSQAGRKNDNDVNELLSRLTPVAEKITGKLGHWRKSDGSSFAKAPTSEWNDTTQDGFGGINVVGGFTPASLSFKSMVTAHCGIWPMPVDSFEESEAYGYQPCVSQILNFFNQKKKNAVVNSDNFLEQEWLPGFFQSITDEYDRQCLFNDQVGFHDVVTKRTLEDSAQDLTGLELVNYFGYPETTLRGDIRRFIEKAQREKKRMFFSHFTSTTHHPWGLPADFESVEYVDTKGKMGWHKDFNRYLNTVRFADAWVGEILQLFERYGIANETLVVFVGDHGQAFREDSTTRTGTYKNGHVSNFRVPITFRHPHIPRVQYEANATSISILPTILDLLINTGSLNDGDTAIASDLIGDYEGQSLIRPYKTSQNGRRAWNFGIINSGASILAVTSADTPWRLVMPLDQTNRWRFTNLENDPLELRAIKDWSMERLAVHVRSIYGGEASQWIAEADAVGRWWAWERMRLWGYNVTGEI